uniref:Uncharacterized protein n=1 Tax=Anguilla anguilla TaxID=7936 RepID=A0A0E9T378_ANGAN
MYFTQRDTNKSRLVRKNNSHRLLDPQVKAFSPVT